MIIPYIVFSLIGCLIGAVSLSEYGWMMMGIGMWSGSLGMSVSVAGWMAWRAAPCADGLSVFDPSPSVSALTGFHPSRGGAE